MPRRLVRIAGLAVLVLGLAFVAFYVIQTFNGYTSEDTAEISSGIAPTTEGTEGTEGTESMEGTEDAEDNSARGPEDETLRLTVPKVDIENATIPTSKPTEAALRDNVAVRLPSTGLPWQEETNVYIAGHELGYPLTDSFRAFYDLKDTEKGDKVYITDANGTEYTYEVFEILIVQPEELWTLDPLEDRNIVSLQVSETQQKQGDVTPKRVVRAELVEKG